MTALNKEISREAHATIREAGQDRPIVVSLKPPGLVGFRAKGCRRTYWLPVTACYTGEYHAQLSVHTDDVHWLYNLYATTGRIMRDQHCQGPHLDVPTAWTFADIVKIVKEAICKMEATHDVE